MQKTILKLDPVLGKRLKVEAALRGVPMIQLASAWIEAHLSVQPPAGQPDFGQKMMAQITAIHGKIPRRRVARPPKGPK